MLPIFAPFILCSLLVVCIIGQFNAADVSGTDFFHQAPEQYKLSPGWQEPGLWRPKWIMYRTFDEITADNERNEEPKKELKDRISFRMKSDRTLKVYKQSNRPFLEISKPKLSSEKKKKLFETGDEDVLSLREKYDKQQMEAKVAELGDGKWWWQDAAPLNQGIVRIETREGTTDDEEDLLRHDVRCDWGTLDGYAAKFRRGKLLKYKMTASGVPVGQYSVGSFSIRVSPHRPLVSKEFLAFE